MTKFFARIALRNRKAVYILSVIITLFFGFFASKIKLNSDWKELLPSDNPIVSDYTDISEYFADITSTVIVIEGDKPEALSDAADKLAKIIRDNLLNVEKPCVKEVYHKLPVEFLKKHRLMLTKPKDLKDALIMLRDPNLIATLKAGVWALVAILILLFIQFLTNRKFTGVKSIVFALGYTILASLPLFVAILWMFGLMYLFAIKFNYLNYIAFPIIIGIGVDDGVHITHRYRKEGRGSLKLVSTSVGKAVLLTSLTTCIGFGAVAFNEMQGMASFGIVAVFGIASCFFATILVVPAILRIKETVYKD